MRIWDKLANTWLGNTGHSAYRAALGQIRCFSILPVGFEFAQAISLSTQRNAPDAMAPIFQRYLNRVVPDIQCQTLPLAYHREPYRRG
jgi:hypothetical protein